MKKLFSSLRCSRSYVTRWPQDKALFKTCWTLPPRWQQQ